MLFLTFVPCTGGVFLPSINWCKQSTVSTLPGSWAEVQERCSNQMQLVQRHHLNADLALMLPAFGCCTPAPIFATKMVLNCGGINIHTHHTTHISRYIYTHAHTSHRRPIPTTSTMLELSIRTVQNPPLHTFM